MGCSLLIGLKSDFTDYYDHWFVGSWQSPSLHYYRFTYDDVPRSEIFRWMDERGIPVPYFGLVNDLYKKTVKERWGKDSHIFGEVVNFVVYTDEYAHASQGKLLLTANEAIETYPQYFAVEFIPTNPLCLGLSYRYLRVGRRQFWLRYKSLDSWMSNYGSVEIQYLCEEKKADSFYFDPVCAIDFITDGIKFYAVDYNKSPRLSRTGIDEVVPAKEVYNWIEEYYEQFSSIF